VTRSTRTATLLDAYALHRARFSPVGGPLGALESPCAPSALSMLLGLTGLGGNHRIVVSRRGRRFEGALHLLAHGYARRWEVLQTGGPTEDDLGQAHALGRRVAHYAVWLERGRGDEVDAIEGGLFYRQRRGHVVTR